MTKVRVNKIDAARRQLDAAIRMTFDDEDAVAIHSVAAAGHRIIRDICDARGNIESYLRFTDWIAPGYEAEFWKAMNASANFFKHADKDVDNIHEMDDEVSDFLIVIAAKWYRDLGNSLTKEMRVFGGWWAIQHPGVLKRESLVEAKLLDGFSALGHLIEGMPRRERLKAGRFALLQSQ